MYQDLIHSLWEHLLPIYNDRTKYEIKHVSSFDSYTHRYEAFYIEIVRLPQNVKFIDIRVSHFHIDLDDDNRYPHLVIRNELNNTQRFIKIEEEDDEQN